MVGLREDVGGQCRAGVFASEVIKNYFLIPYFEVYPAFVGPGSSRPKAGASRPKGVGRRPVGRVKPGTTQPFPLGGRPRRELSGPGLSPRPAPAPRPPACLCRWRPR